MGWGYIKCLDCKTWFDGNLAELKETRKILGPVGEPVFRYGFYADHPGQDVFPRCPKCGLAQRDARWPMLFVVFPGVLFWMAGVTVFVADQSDMIPLAIAMPIFWCALALAGLGFVAALVAHTIAKPVRSLADTSRKPTAL